MIGENLRKNKISNLRSRPVLASPARTETEMWCDFCGWRNKTSEMIFVSRLPDVISFWVIRASLWQSSADENENCKCLKSITTLCDTTTCKQCSLSHDDCSSVLSLIMLSVYLLSHPRRFQSDSPRSVNCFSPFMSDLQIARVRWSWRNIQWPLQRPRIPLRDPAHPEHKTL